MAKAAYRLVSSPRNTRYFVAIKMEPPARRSEEIEIQGTAELSSPCGKAAPRPIGPTALRSYEAECEPSLHGIKEKSVAHVCLLHEMERRENVNGQKSGQVCVPSRRLNFLQDLPELQDHLI